MAHVDVLLAACMAIALAVSLGALFRVLIYAAQRTADPAAPPGDLIALAFAGAGAGAIGVHAIVSFATAIFESLAS